MPKGSRGGSNGGGGGGPLGGGDIISSSSLISEREAYEAEVDSSLEVLRDIENQYGVIVEDMKVSVIKDKRGMTLGYYDNSGNIGINEKAFKNSAGLDKTYDDSVRRGFHPARGNKTGLQAVLAHELGHRLNYVAGGSDWGKLDSTAKDIIARASRTAGYSNKVRQFRNKISGYAGTNNAEAVAESFADVYCNGNKASRESRAVVDELNKYFGGRR